jgi:hypothetical protein
MPLSDVELNQDLTPKRLVFDLGKGDALDFAGIATIRVVGGAAKLAIDRPKSLRVSRRRKGKDGQPDILPLPAARKTA